MKRNLAIAILTALLVSALIYVQERPRPAPERWRSDDSSPRSRPRFDGRPMIGKLTRIAAIFAVAYAAIFVMMWLMRHIPNDAPPNGPVPMYRLM